MAKFYIKQTSQRVTYRDSKGRFISKEKALQQGLVPEIVERTEFKTPKGQFVSKEMVKRSRKKVIEQVETRAETGFRFFTQLGQSVRGTINDAIENGDNVAIYFNGTLLPLTPSQRDLLPQIWVDLSNQAIDRLLKGRSLYYTIDSAFRKGNLVLDLDSISSTDLLPKSKEENRFNRNIKKDMYRILKQYGII